MTIAKLGISSVIPMPGVLIPDSLRSVTEAMYPIIFNTGHRFRDDMPATSSSSIRFNQAHVWPTILQSSEEWQKCLASILKEKYGGATHKIIYDKFLLRPATDKETDGNIRVAWLCDKHHNGWHTPFIPSTLNYVLPTEIWEKNGSKYISHCFQNVPTSIWRNIFTANFYVILAKYTCMLIMYLNHNNHLCIIIKRSLFIVLWMGEGFSFRLVMFLLITTWWKSVMYWAVCYAHILFILGSVH